MTMQDDQQPSERVLPVANGGNVDGEHVQTPVNEFAPKKSRKRMSEEEVGQLAAATMVEIAQQTADDIERAVDLVIKYANEIKTNGMELCAQLRSGAQSMSIKITAFTAVAKEVAVIIREQHDKIDDFGKTNL